MTLNSAAVSATDDAQASQMNNLRNDVIQHTHEGTDTAYLTADAIKTVTESRTLSLPTGATDTIVTLTAAQTLTNKTLTSPVINTPTGIVVGDVSGAAPLASPTFTGTVIFPDSGRITSTGFYPGNQTTRYISDDGSYTTVSGGLWAYDTLRVTGVSNNGIILRQNTTTDRFKLFVGNGTTYTADDNYIINNGTALHIICNGDLTTQSLLVNATGVKVLSGYSTGTVGALDDHDDAMVLHRGMSKADPSALLAVGALEKHDNDLMWDFETTVMLLGGGIYQTRKRVDDNHEYALALERRVAELEARQVVGIKQ
ncbi:MAG: hypothetical protein Q7O66_07435 [Dehalococcoidia bacterium]|nr:hypothetical protein [Dehalococcoidia bacterium]